MLRNRSRGMWDKYPATTIDDQYNQVWAGFFNVMLRYTRIALKIVKSWENSVVTPFMDAKVNEVIHQNIPLRSPVIRCTCIALAYPLWYLPGTVAIVLGYILIPLAATVSMIIAEVLVVFWILFVPFSQFLWYEISRYLVSRFVEPRRQRRLFDNTQVYSDLPDEPSTIRVLRLKPGGHKDKIECDLIEGPLSQMEFEALSYVWGVTLLPYTIKVNGKPFLVTFNLYSALKELRYADRERLLWADAVCINQHDKIEKSIQVRMMRDIYAGASKVVVWLGRSTHATGPMFDFIQQFGAADAEKMTALWRDHTTPPMWKKMRMEHVRMLEHEWWTRAWIIQEIVLGRHVVIQRGRFQVDWEAIHKLFTYSPFGNDEFGNYDPPLFAENVQILREELGNTADSSTTLGDLVIQFRFQSAAIGRDKIYALLGLLKPDSLSLITPDYRKPKDVVFLEFTESCLLRMKNLDILSLACGAQLRGISWCRDWGLNHDGLSKTCRLSALEPPRPFSASERHQPTFEINLERRILSIQGYVADTVARIAPVHVGKFHARFGMEAGEWRIYLVLWEIWAKGLGRVNTTEAKESFNRTVTADCWHTEPLSWVERLTPKQKNSPLNDEDANYMTAVEDACVNRCFFVTEEKRYGLGPLGTKRGDIVSILSGGKTPFILRRRTDKKSTQGSSDEYHRLIGEAFVDGLMYHSGSLREDDTARFHLI